MTYTLYITVVTAVGLLACATFVAGYWWVTRGGWVREEAGRFMMAFMATLGVLFALVLTGQLNNPTVVEWTGRRMAVAAVFTAFVAITWWPLRLLVTAQSRRHE